MRSVQRISQSTGLLQTWDLRIKVIGLVALVASGSWTLYKFSADRQVDLAHEATAELRDQETKKRELNSAIFQRQAALYFDVSSAVAIMATSNDAGDITKARARFEELYYGPLVVVEDRRVELAMITIERCLGEAKDDCDRFPRTERGGSIPLKELEKFGPGTMKNLSLELSACIRTALEVDRKIEFGALSNPKTSCPYD